LNARRLTGWAFQPRGELLEAKVLMAAIDLGGNAITSIPSTSLPRSATAPYGIDEGGATASGGAGWSVADIGDLTGSGYDDILVGAPTLNGSPSKLGTSSGGAVYLIFGSQYVNSSKAVVVQNWLNTTAGPNLNSTGDRVGDLAQLGANPQTNPISAAALTFPFAGITFTATGVDATSSFGASVAEVKTSSGFSILIGAPNAPDANNDAGSAGTGKVFVISGNFLSMNGKTVDVDTPSTYGNLTVLTIVSNANGGGQLGYSVAGGLNILGDGLGDAILGAPMATIGTTANGGTPVANTGAVYLISTALLNTGANTTFNVSTALGTGALTNAVILAGEADGDLAGWSVADAGDVNGATGSVDDLLIGAPDNLGIGAAYLVNGGNTLGSKATLTNNVFYISLSRVGGTATGSVPGAKIVGPGANAGTGFSVSAAGDFNADGFADFVIGSPTFNLGNVTTPNSGETDLIYGSAAGITGTLTIGSLPAAVQSVTLTGANPGDMDGYAVSQVGVINAGQPTGILIGAPGFSSDSGTAYLIMGRVGLTGSFSLSTAQSAPLSGLQFLNTTPNAPSSSPPFFGASLSSRLQGTQQNTVDLDNEADFVIGAPGYDMTQNAARNLAGGVQIVQSGFLVVPIPAPSGYIAPIGVGTPFAPFSINATTPANLQIFVFGVPATATVPAFMPATDIDPTTVVVNGVPFSNATVVQGPNIVNGIPDAIVTISPRSSLNLSPGTVPFVVSGKTLSTAPAPNTNWTGTAAVTVTGGSSTPPVGVVAGIPTGPVLFTEFISPYGGNQFVPSLSQFSALSYQPIPLDVALNQFGPPPGFAQRNYSYYHPGKKLGPQFVSRGQNSRPDGGTRGITTLSSRVFDRSHFHAQHIYLWTHKAPKVPIFNGVVPAQSRRGGFVDHLLH
jgi:hypothetical protein